MIHVLGSVNLDLVGQVMRLPAPGETVSGGDYTLAPGGKGANQALAARRAGAEVRLVAALGDDAFAAPALDLLRGDGVDLSDIAQMAGGRTGVALILVDAAGENVIGVMPGANAAMGEAQVARALDGMQPGDVLLLQQEIPAAANHAAMRQARARGLRVILNIAPFFDDRAADAALADVLVANEEEFARLAGLRESGAAAIAAALSARWDRLGQAAVVTLGAEGALVMSGGRLIRIAAMAIRALDTVGAGDAFCGYLAHGLSRGLDLEGAARRAGVAASLTCLAAGAQPAIPRGPEVDLALAGMRQARA